MTTTATAWRYDRRGPLPTTLKKTEVSLRELKPGEVLVKVYAASLNPVDWKVAALAPGLFNKLPHTAGADFAGKVVTVSTSTDEKVSNSTSWVKPGVRVYGIVPVDESIWSGDGTISTYTIAKITSIGPIPDGMSFIDASGITLVGLTAASLSNKVKSNDKVLILGGTTSVGLLLIQMCLAEGASKVVATCSTSKSSAVQKCGAHEFVDYQNDAETQLKLKYGSNPFDIVFDCVGSFSTFRASPAFLKTQGSFINVGASTLDGSNLLSSTAGFFKNAIQTELIPSWLGGTPRKYIFTGLDVKNLPSLIQYISSGKVKPWTDSIFSFDEAPKAYEYLMKGRALGKVIVKVLDD